MNQLNPRLMQWLKATATAAKSPFPALQRTLPHPLLLAAGAGAALSGIAAAHVLDSIPVFSTAATLVGSFHIARFLGRRVISVDPQAMAADAMARLQTALPPSPHDSLSHDSPTEPPLPGVGHSDGHPGDPGATADGVLPAVSAVTSGGYSVDRDHIPGDDTGHQVPLDAPQPIRLVLAHTGVTKVVLAQELDCWLAKQGLERCALENGTVTMKEINDALPPVPPEVAADMNTSRWTGDTINMPLPVPSALLRANNGVRRHPESQDKSGPGLSEG